MADETPEWLSDLEEKVKNNPRRYVNNMGVEYEPVYDQTTLVSELKNCIYFGQRKTELETGPEQGIKEQIFCYDPQKKKGWIIEVTEDGLGVVTSYGHIKRRTFIRKYTPLAEKIYGKKKEDMIKKVKKYSLLTLPVALIPAIFFGVRKMLGKKKE